MLSSKVFVQRIPADNFKKVRGAYSMLDGIPQVMW